MIYHPLVCLYVHSLCCEQTPPHAHVLLCITSMVSKLFHHMHRNLPQAVISELIKKNPNYKPPVGYDIILGSWACNNVGRIRPAWVPNGKGFTTL